MSMELLILAFEEAEKEIGSSKKTHLAQHLSDLLLENYRYSLNERTLRDYYTNYKNGTSGVQEDLKPKLIACLCDYLGYKDYADFVLQNQNEKIETPEERRRRLAEEKEQRLEEERKRRRRIFVISISVSFGVILLAMIVLKYPILNLNQPNQCMTWADSLYVKVSCDKGPFSIYGTKVDSLDKTKLKNMRKVEVNPAYKFFSDANEPQIWYYKKNSTEIEYYTAPGLHPTNGETLRKITPYIIETYVPIHSKKENSFIKQ